MAAESSRPGGALTRHLVFDCFTIVSCVDTAAHGTDGREILNVGDDKKIADTWLGDDSDILVKVETGAYERVGIMSPLTGTLRWLIDDPARCIERVLASHDGREVALVEIAKLWTFRFISAGSPGRACGAA